MSYTETRSLPVPYRQWFLKRIAREFSEQAEAKKQAMKNNKSESSSRMRDIPVEDIMNRIQEKSFKKG